MAYVLFHYRRKIWKSGDTSRNAIFDCNFTSWSLIGMTFFHFFQYQFTFSNFYLDLYFPFSIRTFVSLLNLDFYICFGLLFLFWTFNSVLNFYFLFWPLFPLRTFIPFLDFYFFFFTFISLFAQIVIWSWISSKFF